MQLFVNKTISQDVGLFQILCIHIHTKMNVVSVSQNTGICCSLCLNKLKLTAGQSLQKVTFLVWIA